jgi:hypothetical protein
VPIKVFISHCVADDALASAVADCLVGATSLNADEVRCTSSLAYRLPAGRDFAQTLREDIGDDSVVIGLITRHTLASSWVLFELGAAWGARKKIIPIVTDEVDVKPLPSPVSGRDIARVTAIRDVAQFIDEVSFMVNVTPRAVAQIAEAIDKLIAAHARHANSLAPTPVRAKPVAKVKGSVFSGMPYSELVDILRSEMVIVPASVNSDKIPRTTQLLDLFVSNAKTLAEGVRSDYERNTAGAFLYQELGLRLLPYNLVQYDKLPAADAKWFKRLSITADGQKFLLEFKRLGIPTT